MSSDAETPLIRAKRLAAEAAITHALSTYKPRVLGVGSGSTIAYIIPHIPKDVICVPTSFQSRELCRDAGLRVGGLEEYNVDVTIDGADEVDANLNAIKGGGGAHLQEKLVASASRRLLIVADARKDSEVLGTTWTQGVPVEVVPMGYRVIATKLEKMGGKPTLRMAKAKAGPVVTDNGNLILDVHFGPIRDPVKVERDIGMIPGVVCVGLFTGMIEKVFFGHEDGRVTSR